MPPIGALPLIGPISQFFATILKAFDGFTGNFALSVILLTVIFRIVVLPLSLKQTKSMIAMQRLQPQLKEIQKKYKDDREKQGQEMMKLYKEHKVHPLGGCLPLLIQLPILFALFDVLHNTKRYVTWDANMRFLGIESIAAPGSVMWSGGKQVFGVTKSYSGGEYWQVILLILLTVITGYISSKMMTTDPKQSKMMAFLPVIMGVFAWMLPAGVTIYIIVTNTLTVVQQYLQLEREGFYDERREQWAKAGEPTGLVGRLRYKASNLSNSLLIKAGIKRPPEPAKKTAKAGGTPGSGKSAQAGKPVAKKSASGKGKKAPAGKPKATKQEVSTAKGKSSAVPGKKAQTAKKASKKSGKTHYPAKKKTSGKG